MARAAANAAREPYGHRAIWAIATPMILAAVTVPLVGLVDTAVVGHLDDRVHLAAVAAGAQVFSVLFVGLNFLRMGTTGLTAQACGADDHEAIRRALGQALLAALLLGLAIILLQLPLREGAIRIIGAEPAVSAGIRAYFDLRVWSAPATLANFVALGWLLGMQNGRGPLLLTLVINGVNIALDLWFVLGLGMTVRGVAAASLVAEYAGAGTGLWLVWRELALRPAAWPLAALRSLSAYRRLFQVNLNLLLRTLALMFTFTFITAQGARMGSVFLAANAVLMNFQWLMSYALDGIANAAEALVGKAVGGRDRAGMELAVGRTLRWSALFATFFTAAYALGGGLLVNALTGLPEVRATAREYLPWLIVSPLISFWSFFYDGVYVGAVRSREMRIIMLTATFGVFLPTWFLFRDYGNHAIWLAFTLFMAARGLGMHLWFRQLLATDALLPTPATDPRSTRQ